MKKYLPALAVILAAILWSFDGILRQSLYTLPSFLIVALEHLIGAIIFLPLLLKGWKEVSDLHQRGWIYVLWISVCGGILGTFFYTPIFFGFYYLLQKKLDVLKSKHILY